MHVLRGPKKSAGSRWLRLVPKYCGWVFIASSAEIGENVQIPPWEAASIRALPPRTSSMFDISTLYKEDKEKRAMDACPEFIGNSDFYGLGIRIGVYLQWISAWITLLLDPESAQATFDANSTFVFAIAIATVIAAQQGADAIEMHLMLQFMLGFFVTTLSTVGVRLWLMSPSRLSNFLTTMKGVLEPVSFAL